MNVIDTRLPELLRGSRPLLGMFVGMPVPGLRKLGVRYIPMVISGLLRQCAALRRGGSPRGGVKDIPL